uniref:Viral peptide n=1 Tax=Fowl adenovirus A serotype 1 (strain CELO / Phelps) TaxID=10553 RepID=Q96587_ADEG1|nr:viral peptide [Fowl aviadenovirus 1]
METAVSAVSEQLRPVLQPPVTVVVEGIDVVHLVHGPSGTNVGKQVYHVGQGNPAIHVKVGGRVDVVCNRVETANAKLVFVGQVVGNVAHDEVAPGGSSNVDLVGGNGTEIELCGNRSGHHVALILLSVGVNFDIAEVGTVVFARPVPVGQEGVSRHALFVAVVVEDAHVVVVLVDGLVPQREVVMTGHHVRQHVLVTQFCVSVLEFHDHVHAGALGVDGSAADARVVVQ